MSEGFKELQLEIERIDPRPARDVRKTQDAEAVKIYESNIDDMPALTLFAKDDGNSRETADHWLGDGYHTLLAHRHLGHIWVKVRVKRGTFVDAFAYACASGLERKETLKRGGVPVFDHDKRHRIEIFEKRPEANGMTERQKANICGCTHQYYNEVITLAGTCQRDHSSSHRNSAFNRTKRLEIEEAIRASPSTSNIQIAKDLDVSRMTVGKVRKELGIAKPRAGPRESTGPPRASNGRPKTGTAAPVSDQRDLFGMGPVLAVVNPEKFRFDDSWERWENLTYATFDAFPDEHKEGFLTRMEMLIRALYFRIPGATPFIEQRIDND